ncbi:hypothetical protein CO112_03590 [Candidatus Dojkabacteria bacterium CG_4_9_14_3_um_filter_150_Dojkabacteria_WS6_41_13]|uniref:NHL repeat containing protein n=1 Tax=Candidatus Dojkabacteria bacterium CG_4_10_14_0_2_um_filter_Dojkabacteria_WS6_41_15 TaxID=2014249 RepID=A0A2M7W106_9BACT|nr:MAG: hypothetical protein COX64_04165 [Candidatus Dojkabacteria bacterium CG_4_10_14_0_2_um_filter_Dojkabacteria_WS6_41_15]PJB22584.1 MAG: hypothetical protein CO112_03590 [Candidatus Dojkabacteria bacterium CG_4_9_14_3_um_filter_150_Dojkabacteria_WS6_41_13]
MYKKILTIAVLMALFFVYGIDKVSALSQVGATASFVLGQPNLNGCATGPNGWSYEKSIGINGTQVSVFDGKLVVPSGNENRVLIYNSIPTQNYVSADVVVGGSTTCSRYPSWDGSELLSTPLGVAYGGNNFLISEAYSNRISVYSHGFPTSNGQIPDVVIGQPERSDSYKSANQGLTVGANTLSLPFSMQIVNGKLIVADRGNNRILIYNSVPTTNNASADIVIGQPNTTSNTVNNGGISASSLNAARGYILMEPSFTFLILEITAY